MNDIEKQEIEAIKKELNIHGECSDLKTLRVMKRLSDGMNEAERIVDQANKPKMKCRVFRAFKNGFR